MAQVIDASATCAEVHEQQPSPTTSHGDVVQDVPQTECEDTQREALSWDTADVTHLSPSALPLARAPRAWERKPQSPFSRRRLKVGKVWKRAVPTQSSLLGQSHATKRFQMFSPSHRAVKKIRLEDGPGLSVGWETLGLPSRRITTRASRLLQSEPAELTQLSEEETDGVEVREAPNGQDESLANATRDSDGGWEDVEHCLGQDDVDRAVASGEEVLDITDIECVSEEEVSEPTCDEPVVSGASILEAEQALPIAPLDTVQSCSLDESREAGPSLDEMDHNNEDRTLKMSNPVTSTTSPEKDQQGAAVPLANKEAAGASAKCTLPLMKQKVHTPQRRQVRDPATPVSLVRPAQATAKLPEGFFTPAPERRRRPIAEVRRGGANRRQTLPVNFVAVETSADVLELLSENGQGGPEGAKPQDLGAKTTETKADFPTAMAERDSESQSISTEMEVVEEELAQQQGDSEDWEDIVEDPEHLDEFAQQRSGEGEVLNDSAAKAPQDSDLIIHTVNESIESAGPSEAMDSTLDNAVPTGSIEQGVLPESMTSEAPGDSIEAETDDHGSSHSINEEQPYAPPSDDDVAPLHSKSFVGDVCELPVRRSPRRQPSRRKSSSPVKSRSINATWDAKPHLVAFTPVKLEHRDWDDGAAEEDPQSPIVSAGSPSAEPDSTEDETAAHESQDSPSGIASGLYLPVAGASVAAPSFPQESPRRSRHPRISDDTLLLQAFLDRAAESKSRAEQRTPPDEHDQEAESRSMTGNPTGADAVITRTENEVLKDLDPNSPSPRKQKSVALKSAHAEQQKASSQDLSAGNGNENLDGTASPEMTQKKRRSSRARKQAESATSEPPAAGVDAVNSNGPNKISIRPTSGDAVVLRKTEAQELAILTRANTRRNKGTAMMPCLRLARLGDDDELSQGHESDSRAAGQEATKPKQKGVRWAATLESFQDSEKSHTALASTITEDTANASEKSGHTADGGEQAPARVRKLKPRLTPRPTINAQFADDIGVDTNSPDPISSAGTSSSQKFEDAGVIPMPAIPKVKRRSRLATPAKIKGASTSVLAMDSEENATLTSIPVVEIGSRPSAADLKAPSVAGPKRSLVSKLPAPVSAFPSTMSNAIAPNREKETMPSLIASPPKKRTRLRSSTRQQQRLQLLPDTVGALSATNKTPTSTLFGAGASMPKLEFQRPEVSISPSEAEPSQSLAGSPAKKAPRLFHAGPRSVLPTESTRIRDTTGVMSSPAKKRGRRV